MTVSIYFADVISDIQVMRRLWHGHHYIWGSQAALLLIGQYLAVYFRALSYFRQTFGACSCMHVAFAAVGFPFGLLALDLLMFLEPFGLLAVLPLPLWLKQFLPAYKATRIVIEVSLESLPQCTLQSYIFLVIQRRLADGTASANDRKLSSFATLLPKSIFISSAAMLKTWVELVRSSRRAGLTVRARFVQLWHVGAGLPFDALKKGTISEWACARPLDAAEVPPILDALATNASLVRLDLCASGLCWSKPDDTGYPLVETLIAKPAALANVHTLLIAMVEVRAEARESPVPLAAASQVAVGTPSLSIAYDTAATLPWRRCRERASLLPTAHSASTSSSWPTCCATSQL